SQRTSRGKSLSWLPSQESPALAMHLAWQPRGRTSAASSSAPLCRGLGRSSAFADPPSPQLRPLVPAAQNVPIVTRCEREIKYRARCRSWQELSTRSGLNLNGFLGGFPQGDRLAAPLRGAGRSHERDHDRSAEEQHPGERIE